MNDLGSEEVGKVYSSDGLLVIFRAYQWFHAISLRRMWLHAPCDRLLEVLKTFAQQGHKF
jgi:hypothetical protein